MQMACGILFVVGRSNVFQTSFDKRNEITLSSAARARSRGR